MICSLIQAHNKFFKKLLLYHEKFKKLPFHLQNTIIMKGGKVNPGLKSGLKLFRQVVRMTLLGEQKKGE